MKDYLILKFKKEKNSLKTKLTVENFKGEKKEWNFDEFETLFHYLPEINSFFREYRFWIVNQSLLSFYNTVNEWYKLLNIDWLTKFLVRHKRLIVNSKLLEDLKILKTITEEEFLRNFDRRTITTFDIPFFLPEIKEECLEVLEESFNEAKELCNKKAIKEEHFREIKRIFSSVEGLKQISSIFLEEEEIKDGTIEENEEENPKEGINENNEGKEIKDKPPEGIKKEKLQLVEVEKITPLDILRESYLLPFRFVIEALNNFPRDFGKKFDIVKLLKVKVSNPVLLLLYKNLFRIFYNTYRINLKDYDIYYPCFKPFEFLDSVDICQKELKFLSKDLLRSIKERYENYKYLQKEKDGINLKAMILFYLILKTIEEFRNIKESELRNDLKGEGIDLDLVFKDEKIEDYKNKLDADIIKKGFKYLVENYVLDNKSLQTIEAEITKETKIKFKKFLFLHFETFKDKGFVDIWKEFLKKENISANDRGILKEFIKIIEKKGVRNIEIFRII